jgi:hypothetical protein
MAKLGIKVSDPTKVANTIVSQATKEKNAAIREKVLAQKDIEEKALLTIRDEVIKWLSPKLEKVGIKPDLAGKQIRLHCDMPNTWNLDVAFPSPLADKTKGSKKPHSEGWTGHKGVVKLRIPEKGITDATVANSLRAFYKFWTGNDYTGFASGSVAVMNIGDGTEGKAGQAGVFNVQNVAGVKGPKDTMSVEPYNVVTLTPKGYDFFGIKKGQAPKAGDKKPQKAEKLAETQPKAEKPAEKPQPIATPEAAKPAEVTATAPTNGKPANWDKMSKAAKRQWYKENRTVAS